MRIHPQIITQNKLPAFIVLPYKEYESLLEGAEDREDIKAVQAFKNSPQNLIPFHILQSIAKGKNAIRLFREYRKLSQTQLANKVAISRQYLCQIENGKRQGNSLTLKKIARTLDVDVDLLIPEIT